MAQEVYEYYFRNYAVHFSSDAMSLAFATIPQVLQLVGCSWMLQCMQLSPSCLQLSIFVLPFYPCM